MAVIDSGSSTSGKANVDSNYNLNVNLPTTASQAGYVQSVYNSTTSVNKIMRITEDNSIYSAEARQLFDLDFNSTSTAWSTKIGTNATTMTKAVTNGFMRLNSGSSVTTGQGIAIYSNRVINIETGYDYVVKFQLRHTNATATNKQAEFGLGYYAFAGGQAAQMNEFIGFRFTTTGTLTAVVGTSQGGAPGETETTLAGFPASDAVAREYQIVITDTSAEFWIDGVYQTRITKPTGAYGNFKSVSYPFIARVFNSGTPASAPIFDIADISVIKIGPDDGMPHAYRMAAMDKSCYYGQPDLLAAATTPHNSPASGTAPTGATGSNTASVLNNTAQIGGFFRMNGATITATAHSIFWIAGYQNPAIPTAAGAGNNARNLYITSITIAPMIVTTVLVGGGFSAIYFASIGATALTSAGTDTDGTTAVAQKADRVIPLSRHISFAAAAAVGVLETGAGDTTIQFPTPLVVHPGEFFKLGIRSIWVNAAVTSGAFDGAIMANGYWD